MAVLSVPRKADLGSWKSACHLGLAAIGLSASCKWFAGQGARARRRRQGR